MTKREFNKHLPRWLRIFKHRAAPFLTREIANPPVRLSNRMRSRAGYCMSKSGIFINSALTYAHTKETFGHEFAHWIEFQLYGTSAHGKRWKKWMRRLKLPAMAHHEGYTELYLLKRGQLFHCDTCHLEMCSNRKLDTSSWKHRACGGRWKKGPFDFEQLIKE